MAIHEERLAVISTAHIPELEAGFVNSYIKDGSLNGMVREEGWLIHAHEPVSGLYRLSFVLGYLKAKGFDWVLFDRDAEVSDELPTFDW